MDEITRGNIGKAVAELGSLPITQEIITDYCKRNKIEPVLVLSDFSDYRFQVEHDSRIVALFPQILAELQHLQYIPEFMQKEERKRISEENDTVRVNIVKLMEEAGVPYATVDTLGNELGRLVSRSISDAGQTAFNKATEVLLHLARTRFGKELDMKLVREYAQEVFLEEDKKKEKKAIDKSMDNL